jgi:hypothetical protein
MKRLIIITVLGFLCFNCIGQSANTRIASTEVNCRDNWQYTDLKNTLTGDVLYHSKAFAHCGVLATASLTIIKTQLNDTIRILWLCNTDKDFKKFETVRIFPAKRPAFSVTPPFQTNQFDCTIKKTYFGFIKPFSISL